MGGDVKTNMPQDNENNLISIKDVLFRAKRRGVDFGKGDPRERLRYLTKIGLLPHAKRKSFNGQPPNGAYPEYVIELLKEIDEKIKAGKSIQELKKEKERKSLVEVPYTYIISPPALEVPQPKIKTPQIGKEPIIKQKPFVKIASILKIVFLVLISGGIIFFLSDREIKREDFYFYLLASLNWAQRLVQAPPAPIEETPEIRETFLPPSPEPYLTINAETDINAPLNVKEQITTPALSLLKGEFRATLASANLTADRTYTFPDLSGIVCLTTGNCIGIGGEVFSPGGIPNRLAKFITSQEIGISSIEDLYPGVALTIDSDGRVGVGIRNPRYPLHVVGRIQATGDICTDLAGGICLSALPLVAVPPAAAPPAAAPIIIGIGIGGSGTANYLPIWTTGTTLGNSIIYQSGSNIGIGTTLAPATLTLSGNAIFATTILPQLVLKYDDENYLNFAINGEQSLIEASKKLVLNSLTGEIRLGDNVNLFDAFGAEVRGATFISTDSTVRKSGELVFRASLPIFRFPVPAQTNSTSFVVVSREISTTTLNAALPEPLPGTTRKFAFLLNFADDIPTNASSTWLVDLTVGTDIKFYFAGQNLPQLKEGVSHLSNFISLPENNWQLKVKVPSGNSIRIFNIFLLTFDQIN